MHCILALGLESSLNRKIVAVCVAMSSSPSS